MFQVGHIQIYLLHAHLAPLVFSQDAVLWDALPVLLGQDHVTVLELSVLVLVGVVNLLQKRKKAKERRRKSQFLKRRQRKEEVEEEAGSNTALFPRIHAVTHLHGHSVRAMCVCVCV